MCAHWKLNCFFPPPTLDLKNRKKKKRSNTELFIHQQVAKFVAECVKNLLCRSMIPRKKA